jgi:hypothetical protein
VALVFILLWCGVGGLIGWAIGNGKGRPAEGFWLGFLLGVIGWIIAAFMAPSPEVAVDALPNQWSFKPKSNKPRRRSRSELVRTVQK